MALGLLAIFSAIGSAIGLVKKSKDVIDNITGKDNDIKSSGDVEKAYELLTPSGQQAFIDKMSKEIDMYNAQTNRLKNEQGTITPGLQAKLSPEDAGKIAKMRMMTRPWVVRKMTHYILFPAYLAFFDVIQLVLFSWLALPKERAFMAFDYCFGKLGDSHKTLFGEMYMYSLGFITSIILTYFTLREVGKHKKGEDTILSSAIGSAKGLFGKLKGIFK